MAVVPTGEIFKTLTFDGQSSGDYGVYITGEAVYNAPARDVEMVTIPGRNGQLALDKGRFENIEVSYPAGIFADNEADFAQAVSDFRNFLASRSGYCRLENDYNPNEYRMAIYKSGLEVDPKLLRAGKFDIVFDCKPQRWLKDGETAVTVASGDTLTNPTLFESSPLLEVYGYGNMAFNGHEIELVNEEMGEVILAEEKTLAGAGNSRRLVDGIMNDGDTFVVEPSTFFWNAIKSAAVSELTITSISDSNPDVQTIRAQEGYYTVFPTLSFTYGTPQVVRNTTTIEGTCVWASGGSTSSFTLSLETDVFYGVSTTRQNIGWRRNISGTLYYVVDMDYTSALSTRGRVVGDSTVSVLGNPTYIDCDIGEAYKITNENLIQLNKYVDLGSDLPKFSTGENEVAFDNTITRLDIIPRWWKI